MALSLSELDEIRKEVAPAVPLELIRAVYAQESGSGLGGVSLTSPKGAVGGFQVTSIAARDIGEDFGLVQTDERINARAGIKYLAKQYDGSIYNTAAKYFGGPNALEDLSITDGRISRGQYAAEIEQRVKNYRGGNMALSPSSSSPASSSSSSSSELISEPPGSRGGDSLIFTQMMEAWGLSKKANASAVDAIDQAVSANTNETNKQIQLVTDLADLQAKVTLDLRTQQLARAGAAARNAATAGIAKDDVNSLFGELVAEYNVAAETTRQMKKGIIERQKIGFLDDPLGFLQANIVDIPAMSMEHNAYADLANSNMDRLATLNSAVQQKNITDAAQIADLSLKGAQAEAEAAALKAQETVSKLKAANSVQIAQLSINRAAAVGKDLNELQQITGIELQIAQGEANKEQRGFLREQRLFVQNERQLQNLIREEKLKEIREKNSPESLEEARAAKELIKDKRELEKLLLEEKYDELQKKKELHQTWVNDLATLGWTEAQYKGARKITQEALTRVIVTGRLADKPMEAFMTLQNIPTIKLTEGQVELVQKFREIYRASKISENMGIPKPEDKINAGNSVISKEFDIFNANPNVEGAKNPYHAPSPAVMSHVFSRSEAFTPIFKNALLTIAETTQQTDVDDLMIVNTVVALIGQGQQSASGKPGYTREMAISDLEKYYNAAAKINNEQKRFQDFNLPIQTKYPIAYKTSGGIFSRDIIVDLMNPTSVSTLITAIQAGKQAQEIRTSPGGAALFSPKN